MQSQSAAYFTAYTGASVGWRYGVDILASDEHTPLEDTSLQDMFAADRLVDGQAQVVLDTTQPTHRRFTMQLRNADGRYLPGPSGYASGGSGTSTATGLVWFTARYRPWVDLQVGNSSSGAPTYERTYLGMFVLTQPEVQVGTQYSAAQARTVLTLMDKSTLFQKPYRITNAQLPTYTLGGHTVGGYASGYNVVSAIADLASKAASVNGFTLRTAFTPSSATLPVDYSIKEGNDYWTHMQALAASIQYTLYFDHKGTLVARPDPLTTNAPKVWTFAPGSSSTMSALDRVVDLSQTFNHIICVGAGSKKAGTVRGEAYVSDPTSPYHANKIGDRIAYVGKDLKLVASAAADALIGTQAQAQAVAQLALARHVGQLESMSIQARNLPALEPFDRVVVNSSQVGVNLDYLASQITWKFQHTQGGSMSLGLSRWFTVGS